MARRKSSSSTDSSISDTEIVLLERLDTYFHPPRASSTVTTPTTTTTTTTCSIGSSSSTNDHLPGETEERMKRMKKEPIHLVSSDMKEHYKEHDFAVRGSRGKTYNVTIGPKLNCTCRDHNVRGTHCKHILYALREEMGVKDEDSPLYKSLTPSDKDLKDAFKNYHPKN